MRVTSGPAWIVAAAPHPEMSFAVLGVAEVIIAAWLMDIVASRGVMCAVLLGA